MGMLQPLTQTLEMPLQPLSKKTTRKKKLVKSRQASAIGLAFPCSILQFFLLLQNLKAEPRCPPPTCSLFFVDTPKTSSYVFIKKNTTNPWQHILNDQVFTKSTTTNEKRMKREKKQKMNGVIYYLLTSFTAKEKKNKAMKSTKHNAVKADYH